MGRPMIYIDRILRMDVYINVWYHIYENKHVIHSKTNEILYVKNVVTSIPHLLIEALRE